MKNTFLKKFRSKTHKTDSRKHNAAGSFEITTFLPELTTDCKLNLVCFKQNLSDCTLIVKMKYEITITSS